MTSRIRIIVEQLHEGKEVVVTSSSLGVQHMTRENSYLVLHTWGDAPIKIEEVQSKDE